MRLEAVSPSLSQHSRNQNGGEVPATAAPAQNLACPPQTTKKENNAWPGPGWVVEIESNGGGPDRKGSIRLSSLKLQNAGSTPPPFPSSAVFAFGLSLPVGISLNVECLSLTSTPGSGDAICGIVPRVGPTLVSQSIQQVLV